MGKHLDRQNQTRFRSWESSATVDLRISDRNNHRHNPIDSHQYRSPPLAPKSDRPHLALRAASGDGVPKYDNAPRLAVVMAASSATAALYQRIWVIPIAYLNERINSRDWVLGGSFDMPESSARL